MSNNSTIKVFIPGYIKLLISLILIVTSLLTFSAIAINLFENSFHLPEDENVQSLFFYSLILFIIINIPWEVLLNKIQRIGPFEFGNAINDQVKALGEIEERLTVLEESYNRTGESEAISDMVYGPEITNKLMEFLYLHSPTAFSPLRIREWGGRQEGFESFSKHDVSIIRRYLRKLVAENKITTTLSKKGNILYRVEDE